LLQERLDKANPRRKKLTREETTKLAKLEGIAERLLNYKTKKESIESWLKKQGIRHEGNLFN
jgi:hypothetical protein